MSTHGQPPGRRDRGPDYSAWQELKEVARDGVQRSFLGATQRDPLRTLAICLAIVGITALGWAMISSDNLTRMGFYGGLGACACLLIVAMLAIYRHGYQATDAAVERLRLEEDERAEGRD